MGHLESITGPRDLRALGDDELDELAARDPRPAGHDVLAARRPPRPQPRRGRADDRDAPLLRLAARPGRLRHRPPGLRAQDAHRPRRGVRHPAAGGRPLRLPEPGRVRARRRRELPRLHGAVLRRRARQGLRAPRRGPPRRRASSATARSPAAWPGRRSTTSPRPTAAESRRLVIVVNDNGRSYTPTVGGLANHLTALRTNPRYEPVLDAVKRRLNGVPGVGPAVYDALHAVKKGMKDALAPQGLFEDLGLKYVGPIDGHDRAAVEHALTQAKRFNGPVIVHAMTKKGFGYDAAERHEADQFHSPGPFDVDTGRRGGPRAHLDRRVRRRDGRASARSAPTSSAITAAMLHPVGLDLFAAALPRPHLRRRHRRAARRHLRRRAGDGRPAPGRRGLRDVPQPGLRPGADGRRAAPVRRHLRARPRRGHRRRRRLPQRHVGHVDPPGRARPAARRARATRARLRELLSEAVQVDDAPTVVRFPKGPPNADIEAVDRVGGVRRARPLRRPGRAPRRGRRDGADLRRGGRPAGRAGHRRDRGRPALGQAGRPGARRRSPASTGWSSASRTTASSAAAARCCCRPSTRPGVDDPGAAARHPAGVPRPRQARADPRAASG